MTHASSISREDLGYTGCPQCKKGLNEPLLLIDQTGFPPGNPQHNIGYGHTVVSACNHCSGGILEVRRHDCFDFEDVWDQYEWFLISPGDMAVLQKHLTACPTPLQSSCTCPLHRGARSSTGTLPRVWWETSLEGARHVHRLSIQWVNEAPRFHVAENISPAVQPEPDIIEIDRDFPADFFRTLNPKYIKTIIGEDLSGQRSIIRWLTYWNFTLSVSVIVLSLMEFGWWTILLLPLSFGWFLSYAAGGTDSHTPTITIAAVVAVLAAAIAFFLPRYLPWFLLCVVWAGSGWMMGFVGKRFLHSVLARNAGARERIRFKE